MLIAFVSFRSIEKFCAEGISLLGILVQSRHLRTVVHVLDKILPLFYPGQYYLLKNEQFLSHLLLFLHLDSGVLQGVTQQVTHKVAQHLTGASHGDNVKLLNSMIQAHISVSTQPNEVGPVAVLEFWVQALISQHLWYREQAILFLMDQLCKTAFQLMQEDCVQKLLYQQHKDLWMEYLNMERIHYEFQETVGLWTQATLESHSPPCSLSVQLDVTNPLL
ncbi:ectopic P granules protein 5 homolog, partial [Leptonychotes weddellii]|uniref:Ectopic P granules protein 5 homolog n=1 Tax=Leptonychotes weddellii TaxID=9713 RepID=A0A2U3Z8F2_LEPWE